MLVKEKPNADQQCDSAGIPYASLIEVDGLIVGGYKKAKFGPGFFVQVFGTTWQNAPGARYPQERDLRTDYTYCRNKSIMVERVKRVLKERLAQAEAAG